MDMIDNIVGVQAYSPVQPITEVGRADASMAASPIQEMEAIAFDKVMRTEIQKVMPTLPVESIDGVDFNSIQTFIEHRDYINRVVPEELNKIAGAFRDKVGFYDASGHTGSYDYHEFEQRV